MSDRSNYLMRLALTCQLADERAAACPNDRLARRYAEAMHLLFLDCLALPEGHPQFEGGAEAASFALVAREAETEACASA
ncbi:MAG: hypothetical protein ACLFSC_12975 [Wenzhouxiangella sp.]